MSPGPPSAKANRAGLGYWMEQVLKEAEKAKQDFAPDPVHDLRVALRRCRSMGEVLLTVNPVPDWKKMRKEGKRVFSSLGDLRDCQVMKEWIEKLGAVDDPVTQRLTEYANAQEATLKVAAADALAKFDTRQWEKWAVSLPRRINRYKVDGEIFQGIALERWAHARGLHQAAMRSKSKVALHRLRIGVKKFRYVGENFLPEIHKQIGDELKQVQDVLGEVHDLDVLWDTAIRTHAYSNVEERTRWQERIRAERAKRVEKYHGWVGGKNSIWAHWRSVLPDDRTAERATFMRLRSWASVLDPDFAHTRRVTSYCSRLYDGLARAEVVNGTPVHRRQLLAAAVMHDVGKNKKNKGHIKRTQEKIREIELPYGWSELDREFVALVARLHRGDWANIPIGERRGIQGGTLKQALQLGGILRLANALDRDHDGVVQGIEVERRENGIIIHAEGLQDSSRLAEKVAAARHLFEVSYGIPVMVKGRQAAPHVIPLSRRRRSSSQAAAAGSAR